MGFTFLISVLLNTMASGALRQVALLPALIILAGIIFIGIIFDTIGTATAAANEVPFHSMSASRVKGAREALRMVREAARVTAFCNDVVGDIAGTVSGAIAITILFQLSFLGVGEALMGAVLIGLVAAVTVGGKAVGKQYAFRYWIEILTWTGKLLRWIEDVLGLRLLGSGNIRPKGRRGRRK